MTVNCYRGDDLDRPIDSFTLGEAEDGSMRYVRTQAWFNFRRCKGLVLRRDETRVAPLAGGLGFAYRTTCPTCKDGDKEMLHVILPSEERGRVIAERGELFRYWTRLISHIELPLEPGSSSTFVGSFEAESINVWNRVAPAKLRVKPASIRIEVVHGAAEAAPSVLVWSE